MRRVKTPQFVPQVVDLRVAHAKRLSTKFLDELGIDFFRWEALSMTRDIISYYDPLNPHRDYEGLEKVMARHKVLVDLIPVLKSEGLI